MYDCEELSVIDVIISLGGREGLGEVSAGVKISVGVLLHKYPAGRGKGGVGHDEKWLGMVGKRKYWLFQECLLYFCKGDFVVYGPLPLGIFVSEGEQGLGQIGESGNEFSVKVAESDEGSDSFYILGGIPVFDGE